MRVRPILALVAVLAIVLAACTSGATPSPSASSPAASAPASAPAESAGASAPASDVSLSGAYLWLITLPTLALMIYPSGLTALARAAAEHLF